MLLAVTSTSRRRRALSSPPKDGVVKLNRIRPGKMIYNNPARNLMSEYRHHHSRELTKPRRVFQEQHDASPESFAQLAQRFAEDGRPDLATGALGATQLTLEEKLTILAEAYDNKALIEETLAQLLKKSTARETATETVTMTMAIEVNRSKAHAKAVRQTLGGLTQSKDRAIAERDAHFLLGEDKPWAR